MVVKDGSQMLVPMNHYLEAVAEMQRLHDKLDRAGHFVNALVKNLESITGKGAGLLAAIKANNALNRGKEAIGKPICQNQEKDPG